MNILYLDDYINYYSKKLGKIIKIKPYKKTLINGKIADKNKFIKSFNKLFIEYNIKSNIIKESIIVIINNIYTEEDKNTIKDILIDYNYKNIIFKSENDYLKIKKNILYINYNYTYYYLLNINTLGNIEINLYNNNYLNKKIISILINTINPNYVIIYGKNTNELIDILNKTKIEYYYYSDIDNLLINILLKK